MKETSLLAAHREIPYRIYAPKGCSDACPVVFFSHGAGGTRAASEWLGPFWASYGYIVLAPTHDDTPTGGAFDLEVGLPTGWAWRVRDFRALLEAVKSGAMPFTVRADTGRLAMTGHSQGSWTAQLMCGMRIRLPQPPPGGASPPDPSQWALDWWRTDEVPFLCGVFLSGVPRGNGWQDPPTSLGTVPGSWSQLTIPFLSSTGSEDFANSDDGAHDGNATGDPMERTRAYNEAPPLTLPGGQPGRFRLTLLGASHNTFSGRNTQHDPTPDDCAEEKRLFQYIKQVTLAFLDRFVKGEARAKAWLASTNLCEASDGNAFLRHPTTASAVLPYWEKNFGP